ncbi:MBL fold metallo-hydrolase [Deinococcus pimensis]|uniref:MBL fold metallo-hydrolase n=1 Tax=Deinococcus pimensis TaxID=309888 RepID=UPI00047F9B95|nr:MBL fold metallo-hydrolase [Deinococcus pimensis]
MAQDTFRVVALGTGAPLHPERGNLALHVSGGGFAPLMLDTGGGLELARQAARVDLRLDDVRHVVLTHRHGDHIGGVMAFVLAGLLDVTYYGPIDALDGARQLIEATYPEVPRPAPERFVAVEAGSRWQVGGFELRFFEVRHRVPTLAVRVEGGGKVLAYSADSVPCDALVACAREADLFVCDALVAESDGQDAARRAAVLMHPTAREAGEMARSARAKSLALVHLARFATGDRVLAEGQAAFGGSTTLPDDGTVLPL